MQYLRSLLYLTVLILSVAGWSTAVLCSVVVPLRKRFELVPSWAQFNLWALDKICGLTYEVVGRENVPGTNSIVYIKHQSVWETMAQLVEFPRQCWVLKRELMWAPLLGWALAALRPIAINRKAHSTAVQQVVRQGKERIADGWWVMIFPEGTRMPVGETRRYGMSGALLASETGRPIVPVAHNAGMFWPRREVLKKPGVVKMVIGPPIQTAGKNPKQINREAQDWIETTVRAIC